MPENGLNLVAEGFRQIVSQEEFVQRLGLAKMIYGSAQILEGILIILQTQEQARLNV